MISNGKKILAEGKRVINIKRQLQFIDSFRFMASGLDSLIKNIVGVNGMMCKGERLKLNSPT